MTPHGNSTTADQNRIRDGYALRISAAAKCIVVFVSSLVLAILLQYRNHAYIAELGYDESSHYVSGVMMHDYVVQHHLVSPAPFLLNFQGHFPLVGIGHWAPLYYVIEAIWMVLVSPARAAALLLSAVIAALIAVSLFSIVAKRFGGILGATAAILFVISRTVQWSAGEIMLDLPVTYLCLFAAIAYARYLEQPGVLWSVLFGVLAAAALLVKGNGLCLALLPPLAVLISRRFDLLSLWTFWLPAPIVVVLVGPWYATTYGMVAAGFRYGWGLHYTATALGANAQILFESVGGLVLALGLLGFLLVVVQRTQLARNAMVVTMSSLFATVWLFQILVPAAIQDRYLDPALPPFLFLSALAIDWIIGRLFPSGAEWFAFRRTAPIGVAAALAVASVLPSAALGHPKRQLGVDPAVAELWRHMDDNNPSVLLATDGLGEVAALSSIVATKPAKPQIFVVRGSRLLGGGGYNTFQYVPRFTTTAEVQHAIDQYSIRFVIYRSTHQPDDWEHVRQVAEAAQTQPERWRLVYRQTRPQYDVRLYEIKGNDTLLDGGRPILELNRPHAFGTNRTDTSR